VNFVHRPYGQKNADKNLDAFALADPRIEHHVRQVMAAVNDAREGYPIDDSEAQANPTAERTEASGV